MPSIRSIGTALPRYTYDRAAIAATGDAWLAKLPEKRAAFHRFLAASKTECRHFAIPTESILALNGLHGRAEHFEREGPPLGIAAVQAALHSSGLKPDAISTLVFTSCSCPSIPAIDALIVERAGFPRTTARIPMYQHGCAGGVVGLGIAAELARLGRPVMVNTVELCSLVFHNGDPTGAELVGSALFADGAAAAVITPEEQGLTFLARESYLIPDSRHLMGYELLDDGMHLRLDRELPRMLSASAPERVRDFLARHHLTQEQVAYWLFHPGGIKILSALESAFHLTPAQAHWSRDVLHSVGNLSSATVLFVLDQFLRARVIRDGEYALMVGIGPGLTLELLLFQQQPETR